MSSVVLRTEEDFNCFFKFAHPRFDPVYVCRWADDLSIAEIQMAQHDGLSNAELEYQNELAEIYPLGPKEYWRSELVGKAIFGLDKHFMTNEEFEKDWHDFE